MHSIERPPHPRGQNQTRARHPGGHRDIPRVLLVPPLAEPGLSIRVLDMAREHSLLVALRQHAPLEAERDLDPSAAGLDGEKDRLGLVMAISRGEAPIATIRFIPFGHGVTLAEKRWAASTRSKVSYGPRSWEVGRLIVAPEHRSMALLKTCLSLAMQELSRASDARCLHASCSPLLARLYRCFGFVTEEVFQSETGAQHVLIHAKLSDVMRALGFAPQARTPRKRAVPCGAMASA